MDLDLLPHPSTPPGAVRFITVQVDRERRGLGLLYIVEGDRERLALPPPQKPYRAEGLWRTTCFEMFLRDGDEDASYHEFNFSPSSQWAAYGFQGYRDGREPLALDEPPIVRYWDEPFGFLLLVSVAIELPETARLGLSAIIEEKDGRLSYWALAHPPGKPDFHHPDCFALDLPLAGQAPSPRT
jgi:hypothetical protein